MLLIVFGLVATGKSTLASALGLKLGWPVISSDRVRKALAGVPPATRVWESYEAGIYAPEFSGRTYRQMLRQARELLAAGKNVILDGSYRRAADRTAARELARETGARAVFIHCTAGDDVIARRLAARRRDPLAVSDGREELLPRQRADFEPTADLAGEPLLLLDTGAPPEAVLGAAREFLYTFQPSLREEQMTKEDIIARVKQRAKDNFKMGMNCAESVFSAVLAEQDWGLPPETMCVVTGFGSGGGLFGGTCGSLNGAIAAVGLAYGRRTPPAGSIDEKKAQLYGKPGLYRIFNRVSNEFQRRFGTTLCREITRPWHGDWFCKDRLRKCLETVTTMAEVAAGMVFPQDLELWGSQPFGENIKGDTD